MAFIDDEVAVIAYEVRYLATAHKALDQRDVDDSGRVPATPANDPDILRIDLQKRLQALNPLGY
jgi:hypothetical protein